VKMYFAFASCFSKPWEECVTWPLRRWPTSQRMWS